MPVTLIRYGCQSPVYFPPAVCVHTLGNMTVTETEVVSVSRFPQQRRRKDYLLAEDHLVVEQEEDPLLVAAVGLVDPGHLPGVDQFRAPV